MSAPAAERVCVRSRATAACFARLARCHARRFRKVAGRAAASKLLCRVRNSRFMQKIYVADWVTLFLMQNSGAKGDSEFCPENEPFPDIVAAEPDQRLGCPENQARNPTWPPAPTWAYITHDNVLYHG